MGKGQTAQSRRLWEGPDTPTKGLWKSQRGFLSEHDSVKSHWHCILSLADVRKISQKLLDSSPCDVMGAYTSRGQI